MSADHTLTAIDGALADYRTGKDAMRWSPDPQHAPTVSDSPLEGISGFHAQLAIWGYALQGDGILETAALIAEGHPELVCGGRAWDRRSAGVSRALIAHGDEPYRPVKDWALLPWVAEHSLRGHMEWPGL